jgi:hypothetical protein
MRKTKSKNLLENESIKNVGDQNLNQRGRTMERIDYEIMIFQWPTLRHFIFQCWKEQNDAKLLDFLFSLDTEDQHLHGGH